MLTVIGSPSSSVPKSCTSDLKSRRANLQARRWPWYGGGFDSSPPIVTITSTSPKRALEPLAPLLSSLPVWPINATCTPVRSYPLHIGEHRALILCAVLVAAGRGNQLGEGVDDDQSDVCAQDRLRSDRVDHLLEGFRVGQVYDWTRNRRMAPLVQTEQPLVCAQASLDQVCPLRCKVSEEQLLPAVEVGEHLGGQDGLGAADLRGEPADRPALGGRGGRVEREHRGVRPRDGLLLGRRPRQRPDRVRPAVRRGGGGGEHGVPGGGVVGVRVARPRGERGVRARQQRRERGDELVVARVLSG